MTAISQDFKALGLPRHRPLVLAAQAIALVFVLFDIETVFLVPWAVIYRSAIESWGGLFIFWEMLVFVAILGVGLLYIWKKGALEWD